MKVIRNDENAKKYSKTLSSLNSEIDLMNNTLFDIAARLAFSKSWAEWSSKQELGKEIFVTYDTLLETGDKHILRILNVMNQLRDIQDGIDNE